MRHFLLATMMAATLPAIPAGAQVVEFKGIPTVAEVIGTLAPEVPESSSNRMAGPATPRSVVATDTGADLTIALPPAALADTPAEPSQPRPRPAARPRQPARGISQPATFAPNSTELPPAVRQMLDVVGAAMGQVPTLNVIITGHTDSSGGPAVNEPLSKRRAEAARSYLVGKGLAETRIVAVGYGARMPLTGTSASNVVNRRIQYLRLPVAG